MNPMQFMSILGLHTESIETIEKFTWETIEQLLKIFGGSKNGPFDKIFLLGVCCAFTSFHTHIAHKCRTFKEVFVSFVRHKNALIFLPFYLHSPRNKARSGQCYSVDLGEKYFNVGITCRSVRIVSCWAWRIAYSWSTPQLPPYTVTSSYSERKMKQWQISLVKLFFIFTHSTGLQSTYSNSKTNGTRTSCFTSDHMNPKHLH